MIVMPRGRRPATGSPSGSTIRARAAPQGMSGIVIGPRTEDFSGKAIFALSVTPRFAIVMSAIDLPESLANAPSFRGGR